MGIMDEHNPMENITICRNTSLETQLRDEIDSARAWARRMMRERDALEAENKRLLAAVEFLIAECTKLRACIEQVGEWSETDGTNYFCTWCGNNRDYRHDPDCPRQVALGLE